MRKTKTDAEALAYWKDNQARYKNDVAAHSEFRTAVVEHRMTLKSQNVTDVEAK
jgi:hypothetical protein